MADLTATIGLNTDELKKGMAEAGKTVEKGFSNTQLAKGIGGIGQIMSGNIGAGVGAMFGPVGEAVGGVFDIIIGKVKELAEYAKELRTIRLATGATYQEIESANAVGKATGVSPQAIASSMVEFRKRAAEASIKGSEMNNALYKMGIGMDKVKDGTIGYWDVVRSLSAAHKAGTDDATLEYYAQTLLGSSFKEMLPIIRMGSTNVKLYNESIYQNSTEAVDAMARFGDAFDRWVTNLKNGSLELLGSYFKYREETDRQYYGIMAEGQIITSRANNRNRNEMEAGWAIEDSAKEFFKKIGPGFSDEERKGFAIKATKDMVGVTDKEKELFIKSFNDLLEKPGNKLNPFGLAPAGGVSSMQSMGGGDLFGAIAFSPLDAIKDNTERTASSLEAMMEMETGMGPSKTDINLQ